MPEPIVAYVAAEMLKNVELFNHQVLGLPIPEVPATLDEGRAQWALTALREEVDEFGEATEKQDVAGAADALIDLVYFALGRLVEMGVPAAAVFEEVQRANMQKERGELSKRPHSKGFDAVKPAGWGAPDHDFLLTFTRSDLRAAELLRKMPAMFKKIAELREAKGADYNNVVGGRDAYFPYGHYSYLHMLNTKMLRLMSLLDAAKRGQAPNFEGMQDTVQDLVNYATFYAERLEKGDLPPC